MPRWRKGQTQFQVAVNYYEKRGAQSPIPKPVITALGHPTAIRFVLLGDKVEVYPARRPLPPGLRGLSGAASGELISLGKSKRNQKSGV